MAGMAKRGTHSARHRAAGPRPGGLGVAPDAIAGYGDAGEQQESGTGPDDAFGSLGYQTGEQKRDVAGQAAPTDGGTAAPAPTRPSRNGRARNLAVRVAAVIGSIVVVVVAGLVGQRPSGNTVAGYVKAFLLDWQAGNYAKAAALTTGSPGEVAAELAALPRQLGADDLVLAMGPLPQNLGSLQPITVHGNRAGVYFNATIDLGRGGLSWQYQGHFTMRRTGDAWRVVWSPSVIVPGLGAGDRLAVLTTVPPRAALLDSSGGSLVPRSHVFELGVVPGAVRNPVRTANDLASAIGLPQADANEMLGQIEAWPPRKFLELVQLSPMGYDLLRGALRRVPDLTLRYRTKRLFASTVPLVTGQVGTETARVLIATGQPYRPGTTVGLSGLQQWYQVRLAGTPTTKIVVQNAAGQQVRVLQEWRGRPGMPVRTTIDTGIQAAARRALAGAGTSAAIVAIRAGSGQLLAVAGSDPGGLPAVEPLTGRYQPGQAFTIVSIEALLASGFTPKPVLPCPRANPVGGQRFTNVPAEHLGPQPSFAADVAHACSTALAGLSLDLQPAQLTAAARQFGVGVPWRLPLPAFPGQLIRPATTAAQAADVIGAGTVQVSPLDMALAAGAVASGRWSAPSLVPGASGGQAAARAGFRAAILSELRSLMLTAVRSGAARLARLPGTPLYGLVGSARLGGRGGLRLIWFVGFRGNVAFAVAAVSRSAAFDPAVQIARQFAAQLHPGL